MTEEEFSDIRDFEYMRTSLQLTAITLFKAKVKLRLRHIANTVVGNVVVAAKKHLISIAPN
jgi:hypothetical protein